MSEVFPNKNPILFGSGEDSIAIIDDEAVAGLTGSLILSEDLDQGQQEQIATLGLGFGNEPRAQTTGGEDAAIATFSNITTPADSVLIIIVATGTFVGNSNFSKNWKIQRNGSIIDTFSLSTSRINQQRAELRIFVDVNPPAGTFNYTVNEDDLTTFGAMNATLFFIKGTDTHAAIIATAATAIKQINSPDTHTTHETEVLP